MFSNKLDFNSFSAPAAESNEKKRKAATSSPVLDVDQFAEELRQQIEKDTRKTERQQLRANKRVYKSKKVRKAADKSARDKSSAKGVGTRGTDKERLDGMIERMIAENPDVDAGKLRKDIEEAHEQCDVSCEKLAKIMEALIPTYEVVKHYRDVLERASNTMFGSKRTFINLSNALRRCLHLIDTMLETQTQRSRNYISLLARTESLARSGGSSFSGLGRPSQGHDSANSSAAMVLYSGAGSQMTQTSENGTMVVGDGSHPVQFAVPLGNGRGMVELRATSAEQVLTGELNESFLECSMARQNHAPVLTEEGEMVRRRANVKRVSHVRAALEHRTSIKAVQEESQRMLAAASKSRAPQIAAPKK